jgi:hypothetical protein
MGLLFKLPITLQVRVKDSKISIEITTILSNVVKKILF